MMQGKRMVSLLTAAALLLSCMLILAVPVSAAGTTMSFGTKSNIKGISQIRWGNMGFGEYDLNVHKDEWPKINGYNNIGDETYENLSMQNLSSVPWFSLTLNAENAGEYEIKIRFKYYDGNNDPAFNKQDQITKAAAFINGERHDFDVVHSSDGNYYMIGSCSLNKGSNGLVVTAMLDCNNKTEQPVKLFNNVTFPAGVSLSDQVYNPLDNTLRLEAETYAAGSGLSVGDRNNASGGKVLVCGFDMFRSDKRVMLTEEEMGVAFDDARAVTANFYLDVAEAGTYTIHLRVNTMDYGIPAEFDDVKPELYVLVNDEKAKKVAITTPANPGVDETFPIENLALKQGRNLVRITTFSKEFMDYAFEHGTDKNNKYSNGLNDTFRFDYIDVPAGVTGVLPNETKFRARDTKDYAHGSKSPDHDDIYGLSYADGGDVTLANLSAKNVSGVPYFTLTVDVPADGYYSVSPEIKYYAVNPVRLGILVDGQKPADSELPMLNATPNNGESARNPSAADWVLHLKKGEYTFTFTGVLSEKPETGAGAETPVGAFLRVYLRGGLTVAETQHTHSAFRLETAVVTDGITPTLPTGLVEPETELTVPVTTAQAGLTPVLGIEYGAGEGYTYQRAQYANGNFIFKLPAADALPDGGGRVSIVYLNDLNRDAMIDVLDLVQIGAAVAPDAPACAFAAYLAADADFSEKVDAADLRGMRNTILGK